MITVYTSYWIFSFTFTENKFDNVVVSGGTVSCYYSNLRYHQWQQSDQIDNLLFSVFDIYLIAPFPR